MLNQKGLTPILIIGLVTAILLSGVFFWQITKKPATPTDPITDVSSPSPSSSETASPSPSGSKKPLASIKGTATPKPTTTATPVATAPPKPICKINTSAPGGYSPLQISYSADATWSKTPASTISEAQWDLNGDGNWDSDFSSSNKLVSYRYVNAADYHIHLRVKDAAGQVSDTCTLTVTISAPKVVCEVHSDTFSGSAPLSANLFYGAKFYGSVDGVDGYVTNVQWDFNGDGNWDTTMDFNNQHISHSFDTPGTYPVKMHLQTSSNLTSDICTGSITAY